MKTREMAALLKEWKVPLLIHQPAYNLLNRWVEKDLLEVTDELGTGVIAFTPLAQGLLTDKYLNGIPKDARVNRPGVVRCSRRTCPKPTSPMCVGSMKSPGVVGKVWRNWRWPGHCATLGDLGVDRC